MDNTEQERELFSRGKQICGRRAGGLILALLKSKGGNVALARSVIELASTKQDPREFVAAAARRNGNGSYQGNSPTAVAIAELRAEGGGCEITLGAADYTVEVARPGREADRELFELPPARRQGLR